MARGRECFSFPGMGPWRERSSFTKSWAASPLLHRPMFVAVFVLGRGSVASKVALPHSTRLFISSRGHQGIQVSPCPTLVAHLSTTTDRVGADPVTSYASCPPKISACGKAGVALDVVSFVCCFFFFCFARKTPLPVLCSVCYRWLAQVVIF